MPGDNHEDVPEVAAAVCSNGLQESSVSKTEDNAALISPPSEAQDRKDSNRGVRTRRTKLPVSQASINGFNLWSHLRHCIGKELSKITMPVQWNEPISFLQRCSEYMNYAHLLRVASSTSSGPEDRLKWVATFAVSALASNLGRLSKPFNPLLGETYQLQRDGFRILSEQVGHHPPVLAFHAEEDDGEQSGTGTVPDQARGRRAFVFRGSVSPKVKFWGKSVEFQPKGTLTVELPLPGSGSTGGDQQQGGKVEHYTWSNVNCQVHNVIVGSLWIEHVGTMEVVNRTTGHRCVLAFRASGATTKGWLSTNSNDASDLHTVEGFLLDPKGRKLAFMYGKWTEFMCCAPISSLQAYFAGLAYVSGAAASEDENNSSRAQSGAAALLDMDKIKEDASNLPKHPHLELGAVEGSDLLWQAEVRPPDSELYYNFSRFTMGLNEFWPPAGLPGGPTTAAAVWPCPTDSRMRPDIRALEEGDLDLASAEKERLEVKQREFRKPFKNKKEQEWWTPRWFSKVKNEYTKDEDWSFLGGFWETGSFDHKGVPEIF